MVQTEMAHRKQDGRRDRGYCPTISPKRKASGGIKTLKRQEEMLAKFDERLWGCIVEYVTVSVDDGMTVVFR